MKAAIEITGDEILIKEFEDINLWIGLKLQTEMK